MLFRARLDTAFNILSPLTLITQARPPKRPALLAPKVRVYLCLPVPAFPGNWGINDPTIRDGVIPILRTVAKDSQCAVIDLYSVLEGKKELVPDKVHPNAEGAALIARHVYKTLTGKDAPEESGK